MRVPLILAALLCVACGGPVSPPATPTNTPLAATRTPVAAFAAPTSTPVALPVQETPLPLDVQRSIAATSIAKIEQTPLRAEPTREPDPTIVGPTVVTPERGGAVARGVIANAPGKHRSVEVEIALFNERREVVGILRDYLWEMRPGEEVAFEATGETTGPWVYFTIRATTFA